MVSQDGNGPSLGWVPVTESLVERRKNQAAKKDQMGRRTNVDRRTTGIQGSVRIGEARSELAAEGSTSEVTTEICGWWSHE